MSKDLITIARFNFPNDPDFLLFLHELEDAGIPYVCPERTQLEVNPLSSMAFGGLRVQVNAPDAAKATVLYQAITDTPNTEPDEADQEIARMKAADEAVRKRNFRICLIGLVVLGLLILGESVFRAAR